GVLAGADGVYNTNDDLVALGRSTVGSFSVGGSTRDVLVRSDIVSSVSGDGIRVNGGGLNAEDALIAKNNPNGTSVGASLNISLGGGERATLAFAGPGRAVWNSNTRTISLVDTTLASSLVVTSTNGQTLSNLNIVTNDDASIGTLTINAILSGNSNIVVDADGTTLTATGLTTSGRVVYGGNLGTLRVVNDFLRGSFAAKDVASVSITGSFGDPNLALRNEATIAATNVGTVAITGQDRGVIVIAREANAINVTGTIANALIRVGSRLGSLTAGELSRTRVSVGDFLGGSNASGSNTGGNQTVQAVRINGNVFDSAIMVGGDLGADAEIGGSRLSADRVTSGFLGSVFVGGNFIESDIVAGLLRGPDGFFGTSDDAVAAGRSTIGTVTIVGSQVGSNRFTESYRIASTGSLRGVTIAGRPAQNQLNFETRELGFQPLEIQVDDVVVGLENDQFVATVFFNQAIDQATLDTALSVREVRQGGQVQVFLISGEDYTLRYDAARNAAIVTFSRNVTEANLPITPGSPAVGVFNFVIDDAVIRGSLSSARLDGNGDGFARGDDYNIAEIIGDAGDKLNPGTANVFQGGNLVHSVDYYGPVDLDVVLDRQDVRDSLPDVNSPVIIRGSIGDHADQNVNHFRFAGDTDVYKITLQAGQILQLGAMQGAAQQAQRVLLNSGGQGATGAQVTTLIAGGLNFRSLDATFAESYYIRQSGVYYIAIGEGAGSVGATGTVTNPSSAQPSTLGPYSFTIEVFDDFDSGFSADTDSGDGTAIVNAPPANQFTTPGQVITVGDYSFTLTTNAQGQQVVTGANSLGVTSTRAGGTLTTTIASAIGPGGLSGVPNTPYGDLDVYHLNNRATITNGSVIRVTLKVSEVGGDLGSKTVDSGFLPIDVTSVVQLGIFDTTTSSGIDDGLLFASPSQFTGVGGEPNTVLSDNGAIEYGFDANGDFYIEFVAAGRAGADGESGTADDTAASYAVYVQGAFNTDYQLEIVTAGT
ncbi:MAG: hypothetical protein KDA05_03490, partial [Phycisphaerales bacterium]|nr:hypothetical protein [Phycisphaerales bacterium]